MAAAVVAAATAKALSLAPVAGFAAETGKGVSGVVQGRRLLLGNVRLFADHGILLGVLSERADALRAQGATVVFVAVDGEAAGLLGVSDPIKPTAREAIRLLHKEGVAVVIVTGDSRTTAQAVARALGLDRVEAEVLPERKREIVRQLQAIRGVARARRLSRATIRNIRQNLVWAFGYDTLGVPIAAGVLYPVFGLLLSPINRECGDDVQLGFGDREGVAAAPCGTLRTEPRRSPTRRLSAP